VTDHDWEPVNDDTQRLAVPGGWLYRTWIIDDDGAPFAVAFVPDANHADAKPADVQPVDAVPVRGIVADDDNLPF
jgi:hypothetical protein